MAVQAIVDVRGGEGRDRGRRGQSHERGRVLLPNARQCGTRSRKTPSVRRRWSQCYYPHIRRTSEGLATSKWFRLAAEQGDAWAQRLLGDMHYLGRGVPRRDYVEAVRWYRLPAEQGDVNNQYNLGYMYYNGEGVPQDNVLAHMWFNLAASKGVAGAAQLRDDVASRMTRNQIAEAQKLAWEWAEAHP